MFNAYKYIDGLASAQGWPKVYRVTGLPRMEELVADVRETEFPCVAVEIGADAILLAKNIDGVYSADPAKDPAAVKYDKITYDEVLKQHLAVMDSTATSLSMDNHMPIVVFALKDPENIRRVVMGEQIGTTVKEEF